MPLRFALPMRLLRLPPSPKSRRLLAVLTGTVCLVALAASAMGTSSRNAAAWGSAARGSAATADVAPDWP
jgi:hypothetical protein